MQTTDDFRPVEDEDALRRAFLAYRRAATRKGFIYDQPANYSGVVEGDGRTYVVLRNCNGILAVYQVTASGRLKGLEEWPQELETW